MYCIIFCVLCIMSLQQGRTALPIAWRLNYKSIKSINQLKDRDTLIEQSYILINQSIDQVFMEHNGP